MDIKRSIASLKLWRGIGNVLEQEVINAKHKLVIVTPWISKKYAELLYKKSKDLGKENVVLVTTEGVRNYEALKDFANKRLNKQDFAFNLVFLIFSLMLSAYLFYLFVDSGAFIMLVISFVVLIASFMFYINLRESFYISFPFTLIVQSNQHNNYFIHAKIYAIDDKLYLSSANFTETGLWKNIEFLVLIEERAAVEEIEHYLNNIKTKISALSEEDFIKKYAIKSKFLSFRF